jgi:hypothetical protein
MGASAVEVPAEGGGRAEHDPLRPAPVEQLEQSIPLDSALGARARGDRAGLRSLTGLTRWLGACRHPYSFVADSCRPGGPDDQRPGLC